MSPPDGAAEIRRLIDMAEEFEWPDPQPLFEPSEAERPYPLDALPSVIARAITEYRTYGQQPLALIAGSALATTSLASQGLADVARDRQLRGPISLHLNVIAVSGERKTTVDRTFNKPLREWMIERQQALQPEADWARANLDAWAAERDGLLSKIKSASGRKGTGVEADISAFKKRLAELEAGRPDQPILPSLFFEDTNAERLAVDIANGWPSASIWSDEGGLVVGSHGMSDDNLMRFIGLLNRLWDGHPFERRRLTTPSAIIRGRRLTVSLMMQPIVFARLIGAKGGAARGMGWIARTLTSWPKSAIGSRPYRTASAMPGLDAFHSRVRELLDLPLPVEGAGMVLELPVLCLAPPAFALWRFLHDDVEAALSRVGEFGNIPDIGAKIAENSARLAANFHIVERGPGGSIDAATMEAAATVAVWYLNEARRVIAANERPQDATDAELLLDWLLREPAGPIEPRIILNRGPNSLRNKPRRDAAIKVLIEKHWILEVKDGRTTRLALNPKARAAW
jgi:hypothetical protein